MKTKLLFPIATGLTAIILAACSGSGGNVTTPTQEPTPASLAATQPPPTTPATATATAAPTEEPSPTPLATEGDLFLQLLEPAETEVVTSQPSIDVVGRTRVDAVVTINDTIVEPDADGQFSLTVDLEEGPNIIEVVASVASEEQKDLVLVAIYVP